MEYFLADYPYMLGTGLAAVCVYVLFVKMVVNKVKFGGGDDEH